MFGTVAAAACACLKLGTQRWDVEVGRGVWWLTSFCLAKDAAAAAHIYAHGQASEAHAGVGGQAYVVGGPQSVWQRTQLRQVSAECVGSCRLVRFVSFSLYMYNRQVGLKRGASGHFSMLYVSGRH